MSARKLQTRGCHVIRVSSLLLFHGAILRKAAATWRARAFLFSRPHARRCCMLCVSRMREGYKRSRLSAPTRYLRNERRAVLYRYDVSALGGGFAGWSGFSCGFFFSDAFVEVFLGWSSFRFNPFQTQQSNFSKSFSLLCCSGKIKNRYRFAFLFLLAIKDLDRIYYKNISFLYLIPILIDRQRSHNALQL